MSFQSDVSLEKGPIQRLLIVHLKLAELSTGNPLDESASTEELCEQILYFHSSVSASINPSDTAAAQEETYSYSVEEAIQFTGLCSALYSLPSSIDPVQAQDDHTREIYLDNCCIVFQPLEVEVGTKDIVAVAQIARRPPHLSGSHGGTPSAVGAAILRSHRLFCLLRGGGIHKRLAASTDASSAGDVDNCILYAGMNVLFKLRKQARKIEAKSARLSAPDLEMQDELRTIQAELELLIPTLPIRCLREDLRRHYDAFLGDSAQLATENGASCRCLVQALPVPVALPSGSHLLGSTPSALNASAPQLDLVVQALLENIGTLQGETRPRLFGISTFTQGQLAFTRMLQSDEFSSSTCTVSNETACALMGYLASFRFEMRKQHDRLTNSGSRTPPRLKQPFRPLAALSFGTGVDEARPQDIPMTSEEGFLAPPSLSLLCPSDEGHDFSGCQDDDRVWAPLVDLALCRGDDLPQDLPSVKTRVCLYDYEDLSFLLYILPVTDEEEHDSSYKDLFHKTATQISTALAQIQAPDERQSDGSPLGHRVRMETRHWEQPGREIVFIDRSSQTLVLFSHRIRDANNNNNVSNERSEKKNRFFKSSTQSTQQRNPNFDCRHLLASHLSLDSVLAFEDVMNEVGQNQSAKNRDENRPIEICTFIPEGWMFANADRGHELYVLFDSKLHVTVADVQNAALQIWKELMGGGWTD
jgi:hypothetical protein